MIGLLVQLFFNIICIKYFSLIFLMKFKRGALFLFPLITIAIILLDFWIMFRQLGAPDTMAIALTPFFYIKLFIFGLVSFVIQILINKIFIR